MASKTTAETAPYKTPSKPTISKESDQKFSVGKADHASYTPNSNINELSYAKDGGKPACLGNVPSVVVGGASEVAPLPKMPGGNFSIGVNGNVSDIIPGDGD